LACHGLFAGARWLIVGRIRATEMCAGPCLSSSWQPWETLQRASNEIGDTRPGRRRSILQDPMKRVWLEGSVAAVVIMMEIFPAHGRTAPDRRIKPTTSNKPAGDQLTIRFHLGPNGCDCKVPRWQRVARKLTARPLMIQRLEFLSASSCIPNQAERLVRWKSISAYGLSASVISGTP